MFRPWILLPFTIGSVYPADGLEIELGVATHHWVSEGLYEDNRLVGTGYKRWEASTFINSFGDRSYSGSYRWDLFRGLSVSSGIIHGYGVNATWFPMRIDDEVVFVSLNAETFMQAPVNLRLRVLGEATILSLVVRPPV
ncbi:hypothetical protein [Saccharospirillum mangrovi]|uniref:hypothetical protein n=1 Tax=Saccharospirillum mangrovi TaxID=2161747 RepID=UPI000D34B4D7|nr:hypothetical protein [Saccharospirillum mangrovi]